MESLNKTGQAPDVYEESEVTLAPLDGRSVAILG